jgi:hypothetical protein
MLEINKNYVLDKDQKPIAVQIPIAEFVCRVAIKISSVEF